MIEWLRGLPLPKRYSAYVVGAFLVFLAAVGVGATAAILVGWQSERVATGSGGLAGARAPENTAVETTVGGDAFENTSMETTTDTREATVDGPADQASFVHRATDENSRGDYTYLDHPDLNGKPGAAFIVLLSSDRGSAGGDSYDHNIGVWYEFVDQQKWAIFNQDRAAVPAGATFEIVVSPASTTFVHRAGLVNTVENNTYLDDPLTNGEPDAVLSVTQNWNPGGGVGVYNDHPVGFLYDSDVKQWTIYNRDGAPMPDGAAFNVAVSGDDARAR